MASQFQPQTVAADVASPEPDLDVIVLDPSPTWQAGPDGTPAPATTYTGLVPVAQRRGRSWVPRLLAELRLPRR
jgi:hypothetical protein